MDFTEICRICCEIRPDLRPILESDDDDDDFLHQLFHQVLRLEISADDGLPQNVCTLCRETLRNVQETIAMARANDAMLRKQQQRLARRGDEERQVTAEFIQQKSAKSSPQKSRRYLTT